MAALIRGSSGPDVKKLHEHLQSRGFSSGNIDSNFGGGTEVAPIAFQKSEGLLAYGVARPKMLATLGLADPEDTSTVIPGITVAVVSQMFPSMPIGNIKTNLPSVLDALVDAHLSDKPMALMALATNRAETESFQPIAEGQSRFNSSPNGHPFDLYGNRKNLGNLGPPHGANFRGRGFVQLTGRANYSKFGEAIRLGDQLAKNPEQASDPDIAGKLFAAFLAAHEMAINQALLEDDLKTARKLVNGGSNGLDRFTDAYAISNRLLV